MPSLAPDPTAQHRITRGDADAFASVEFRQAVLEVVTPLLRGSIERRVPVNLDDPRILVDLDFDIHRPAQIASHEVIEDLSLMAQRMTSIQDKLQDLSSQLHGANIHRQEALQSSDGHPPESSSVPTPSCDNLQEDWQARPSATLSLQSGRTVSFLEVAAKELYPFQKSTWDIAVFIGTPSLGIGGSGFAVVLVLINIMMQGVFLGIVRLNFSEALIDDTTIQTTMKWRISIAHDEHFMDPQTGHSLVSRVCHHDQSLHIASSQESLYLYIHEYLNHEATGLWALFDGTMLCIVALLCWYLMVSKEMHSAVDLFRAIMYLDRSVDKLERVERPGQTTMYRLASVSRTGVIVSAIVVAYRLIVCGVLALFGTYFLVYTIEITELVLNAVALDIILNIDDLLFDAMVTANTKHLVVRLEPLEMPRWPHCKGIDLRAVSMATIIFSAVISAYYKFICPMLDDLTRLADTLCAGTQNFVWATDKLNMTVFGTTPPCASASGCGLTLQDYQLVQNFAVGEAVRHGPRNDSEFAIWVGDEHDVHDRAALDRSQLIEHVSRGSCLDNLQGPYLQYMRQAVADKSISDCKGLIKWCSIFNDDKGLLARLFCPRTCECDKLGGGATRYDGCPAACKRLANMSGGV